jgi:hypothetical protein
MDPMKIERERERERERKRRKNTDRLGRLIMVNVSVNG